MRILYVGPLFGVCEQRRVIFEELGHNVFPIDTNIASKRLSPKWLISKLSDRIGYPLDLDGLNKKILAECQRSQVDIVWIDKGQMIYPRTLKSIKALMPYVQVVNFNPDDPFCPIQWGWGWFKKCIPLYDLCFVPRDIGIVEHEKAGAKAVKRFCWGYSPHIHKPMNVTSSERKKLGGNVGFIGTFEKARAEMMQALADSGIEVRIWGERWENRAMQHPNLQIKGKPLWAHDFTKAICSFDINLCFLNKLNRDTLNTRCFAIPACGAFMLAERTDDLRMHFEEGKEAEFFSTKEELIDKTRFYLKYDTLRRKIAEAGRQRCFKSDYSNHERLKGMLQQLKKHL